MKWDLGWGWLSPDFRFAGLSLAMVKYSYDQVVRGIESFTSEYLGETFELQPEQPLHIHLQRFESQELCSLMFLEELAAYFGVSFPERRVLGWLKLRSGEEAATGICGTKLCRSTSSQKTKRTGADLVRFIVRRAECPDFGPKSILGHRCESAGCFLGIAELVVSSRRFTPSTPIRQRLSTREFHELASRLQWLFDCNKLVDPSARPKIVCHRIANTVVFAATATAIWVSVSMANSDTWLVCLLLPLIVLIAAVFACNRFVEWLQRYLGLEIAPGIRTFRDLTESVMRSSASF